MTQRLGSFQTVLADRNLRSVELAFLGFNRPGSRILRLLRAIPLLRATPGPAMERVMAADVIARDPAVGGVLIREGDRGDLFYVIVVGTVEITRAGEHVSSRDRVRRSARSPC